MVQAKPNVKDGGVGSHEKHEAFIFKFMALTNLPDVCMKAKQFTVKRKEYLIGEEGRWGGAEQGGRCRDWKVSA